jgi:hypothetical protein
MLQANKMFELRSTPQTATSKFERLSPPQCFLGTNTNKAREQNQESEELHKINNTT